MREGWWTFASPRPVQHSNIIGKSTENGVVVSTVLPTVGRPGVPRSSETLPSNDPAVGLYLGSYGGPRGLVRSYERGAPVQ